MTAFWAGGRYWEHTLYMDLWNDEIIAYGWQKGNPSTYFDVMDTLLALKEKHPELRMISHSD